MLLVLWVEGLVLVVHGLGAAGMGQASLRGCLLLCGGRERRERELARAPALRLHTVASAWRRVLGRVHTLQCAVLDASLCMQAAAERRGTVREPVRIARNRSVLSAVLLSLTVAVAVAGAGAWTLVLAVRLSLGLTLAVRLRLMCGLRLDLTLTVALTVAVALTLTLTLHLALPLMCGLRRP